MNHNTWFVLAAVVWQAAFLAYAVHYARQNSQGTRAAIHQHRTPEGES